MHYPTFHYRWEFKLHASPEALWPLVSDTNRFNRDTGVPAVQRLTTPSLQNARQRLRLHRLGVPIEWEEEPFEWVRPKRFGVVRRYLQGPVARMEVRAELEPLPRGGTHLVYQVWATPRSLFGLLAIPAQIGLLNARQFQTVFRRYDHLAGGHTASSPLPRSHHLSPGGRARLAALQQSVVEEGFPPDLVQRLAEVIETGDDLEVSHLRPYALADAWDAPRREVLELCLSATRIGLLELRWELLCPLCRGAKEQVSSLSAIGSFVHCDVCKIDVRINLDRFVEVIFVPNSLVRPVDVGTFCVGGPQVTPHIVAQQLVQPGEERTISLPLEPGRYRIRTLMIPGGLTLTVAADGEDEYSVEIGPADWPDVEPALAPTPTLHLYNATPDEQLIILERLAWTDQAATAADVISLQRFRDLFAREALRPDQPISVGSLAALFTDLRDSTRLYRSIGDAPAFGLVMDHFDVLRGAVAAEGGAVVKTIGDAVMATFQNPAAGLRAILAAQQTLAAGKAGEPLLLKAGVHYGPCIAVTLNDRLDYFGSTVNIAARLEGLATGRDVVVSSAVYNDPEVTALLADPERRLTVESLHVTLKGLEEDEAAVWRLTADRLPDSTPQAKHIDASPQGRDVDTPRVSAQLDV